VLRGTAAKAAAEIASDVRTKLLKLGELLRQELSKTADVLRSTDMPRPEDFQILAEMPAFHMNRQDGFAKRPILGRLGRWFRVHSARHRIQAHESGLKLALESFSRLLYAWGLDASTDLERRFDSFANRYRAQLERLLLDRKQSTINPAQVSSDLDVLARMFAADSPTTNTEAIAS
jgi:hypothetical protein